MLIMRTEKRHMRERIKLPNQEKSECSEKKENHPYWRILEVNTIKQAEMEEKNLKSVSQENKKTTRNQTLWQKSHQINERLGYPLCKILGTIREELKQMDQRTRKLMTMHKALHPRDDVDRLHVSRKE